ncbi:MAG: hypothetical protein ACLFRI_00060 [Candidatus Izemoplasmataceae bacterium]
MKKYLKLLRFELKSITRDKITTVMLVYPALIVFIGAYVLPLILERFGDDTLGTKIAAMVMIIIFAALGPFINAALLGFSLLDNRDDNTLDTIRVTPISLRGYVTFKSVYAYLLSVNASFWIIFLTDKLGQDAYTFMGSNLFQDFTLLLIITYALIAGLFTPLFGIFLAAVAKNKIEGFAYMKSSGIIVMLPALVVINTMQDYKQYFLGITPIFWPLKGLMTGGNLLENEANLPPFIYFLIGFIYMIILLILSYKVFENKVQQAH